MGATSFAQYFIGDYSTPHAPPLLGAFVVQPGAITLLVNGEKLCLI